MDNIKDNEIQLGIQLENVLNPIMENLYLKYQDLSSIFSEITEIYLIKDCSVMPCANVQLNPATSLNGNGSYPHQNLLAFKLKKHIFYFDLNEGGILSNNYEVMENTGEMNILYSSSGNVVEYTIEELTKIDEYKNSKYQVLKNLKHQRKSWSDEDFQAELEEKYNIHFETENCYLEDKVILDSEDELNFRLFLTIDLPTKDVDFTDEVSIYKDFMWQEAILLNKVLASLKDVSSPEVEVVLDVPEEVSHE